MKARTSGKVRAFQPFYIWPMQRLKEILAPSATSVRSLPDDQLQTELDQLASICGEPDPHYAEELMHRVYSDEVSRRSDPEQCHDEALDAALSRLERQTSEADRIMVRAIGETIHKAGGIPAMERACQRMLARSKPEKQDLRRRIIEKRWAGIGARCAG